MNWKKLVAIFFVILLLICSTGGIVYYKHVNKTPVLTEVKIIDIVTNKNANGDLQYMSTLIERSSDGVRFSVPGYYGKVGDVFKLEVK